jgi:uncharacterized membrane protein
MDILSNPVFTLLPFAVWIMLIAVALYTFSSTGEGPRVTFRSARDVLDEHLARHDIDRDEYVDRRKALDYITGLA